MAYDERAAQRLRDALVGLSVTEKYMFGGVAFTLHGNMLCGVHQRGVMFRVGKAQQAEALDIPGTRVMDFTGRRMGGIVEADAGLLADESRFAPLLGHALSFVSALPPK